MAKGDPISVPNVPWHLDPPREDPIDYEAGVAALSNAEPEKCCNQDCSRCKRKQSQ